jgi:hypothetical protein
MLLHGFTAEQLAEADNHAVLQQVVVVFCEAQHLAGVTRVTPQLPALADAHTMNRNSGATAVLAMRSRRESVFKVNLIAVVRVRAADESVAREVIPTVLRAPGNAEMGVANQNNAATGRDAAVTSVDFSVGPIKRG